MKFYHRVTGILSKSFLRVGGSSSIFIVVIFSLWSAISAEKVSEPNILHILTDDLGWTALSCYGNRDFATPHPDRLAGEGLRFTNAYADAQCSPTRAAFLS